MKHLVCIVAFLSFCNCGFAQIAQKDSNTLITKKTITPPKCKIVAGYANICYGDIPPPKKDSTNYYGLKKGDCIKWWKDSGEWYEGQIIDLRDKKICDVKLFDGSAIVTFDLSRDCKLNCAI